MKAPWPARRGGILAVIAAAVLVLVALTLTPGVRGRRTITAVPPASTPLIENGVVVYYFHTTLRCPSCRKIEAYAKLAVETAFEGDMAAGRLQFRPVNIETDGNQHFTDDYQLYTKSLILSLRSSGREVRWKNLNRVWELLGDEPSFVAYVQDETRAFLDVAP